MDPFRKVTDGDPLRIPATAYNSMLDAALAHRGNPGGALDEQAPARRHIQNPAIVQVRNVSEAHLDELSVVGLTVPAIGPDINASAFIDDLIMDAIAPQVDDLGRFAILMRPLAADAIGPAIIAGITVARVVAGPDDQFADAQPGEADHLVGVSEGTVPILWIEPFDEKQPEAPRWAVVRLGGGGGGSPVMPARVIEVHDDWLLVSILGPVDPQEPEAGPTIIQERVPVAKPYLLRREPFHDKRFGDLQYDYDPVDPSPFTEWDSATQRQVGRRFWPDPEDPDEFELVLENQVIVPPYQGPIDAEDTPGTGGDIGGGSDGGYDGDIIYITRALTHVQATGNFDDPEGQGYDPEHEETVDVQWLDLNIDGRSWAEDNRP